METFSTRFEPIRVKEVVFVKFFLKSIETFEIVSQKALIQYYVYKRKQLVCFLTLYFDKF